MINRNRLTTVLFTFLSCSLAAAAVRAEAQCDKPQLLIILDKSSSMVRGTVPTGETKWEAARIAVNTLTESFRSSIDFGLMVFPYPDQCSPGRVVVDIGPMSYDAIQEHLVDPPPWSGHHTPMAQSLEEASAYAPLSDASRRRAVVLVTDGWQYCVPYENSMRYLPVEAAALLRATGATLYVVGFGDGVDSLVLNRVAVESNTYLEGCNVDQQDPFASDNCYHQAMDLESLTLALDSIARHVTEEVCDGLDNNCDGAVDEGLARGCLTACGAGTETCVDGAWTGCTAALPGAEVCDGVLDEDCDGLVDEGCECTAGEKRTCGVDVGLCKPGEQLCRDGVWSDCEGMLGPSMEYCDGMDNDCNGETDEGVLCPAGEVCLLGECTLVENPGTPPEQSTDDGHDYETGCGCALAGREAALPVPALFLLAAFGLLILTSRRRRG